MEVDKEEVLQALLSMFIFLNIELNLIVLNI